MIIFKKQVHQNKKRIQYRFVVDDLKNNNV